jgi:N-formylmaleamate deformylase
MTSAFGAHVHANGIRQHYLRHGQRGARPLILVPGITSPAATWAFVAEALAADFEVYTLDVRGRGLSEAGPHLDYGLDACADDLIAFAEALNLNQAVLMGHSMGARHGVRACRRDAQRFERLALIDPPVSGPGRRPYPAKLPWYIDSMALARYGAGVDDLRPFTPTWTQAEIALRAEWLPTCDEAAVRASYASFHDDDIHQDLARLTLPTLLMSAERGDVIRDEDEAEIRRLNPAIQTTRVADAGHMIPWDNLPGFLAALHPFLTAAIPVGDLSL